MVSPPPWPERPDYAQDFDEFWLCAFHLPPDPWPDDLPPDEWAAKWGPPGTVWTYSVTQLINRLTVTGAGQGAQALVNRYLRTIKGLTLPPYYTLSWTNPGPGTVFREDFSMRWIRAVVHAKLGTVEEVAHTFTLRTQPAPDVTQSASDMSTLAGQIRDRWQAFLDATVPGTSNTVKSLLSPNLAYDEVRCAYLEQTAPGAKNAAGKMILPKPAYLVPTQYASFTNAAKGSWASGNDLPWEVAACLTLNTNVRGASFRGRTYLGGLTDGLMGTGGLFNTSRMPQIAGLFGSVFLDGVNKNTGAQFQVVSRTHLHAAPIQGVRFGLVPDAQRSRRRHQAEAYTQAWGQGVGAVPPA